MSNEPSEQYNIDFNINHDPDPIANEKHNVPFVEDDEQIGGFKIGFNNLKNKFNGGFQRLNEVGDIANNLGVDELSDISSSISEFSDMDLIDINSYTIPGENVLFDLVDSLI